MSTASHCFGESRRLPALGSEELESLCQKLEQQVPKAALPSHVAPASANPKLTDNSAATFSSSGSARVDLFFKCEANQLSPFSSDYGDSDGEDNAAAGNDLNVILSQVCCICRLHRILAHRCAACLQTQRRSRFRTCSSVDVLQLQHSCSPAFPLH